VSRELKKIGTKTGWVFFFKAHHQKIIIGVTFVWNFVFFIPMVAFIHRKQVLSGFLFDEEALLADCVCDF